MYISTFIWLHLVLQYLYHFAYCFPQFLILSNNITINIFQNTMTISKCDEGHGRVYRGKQRLNYLHILQWNIQGVISPVHGNKFEDEEFIKTINGQNLVILTETHEWDARTSKEKGENFSMHIDGFTIKSKPRPKSKKAKTHFGGLAIAVKNGLENNINILNSRSENIMWIRIACSGMEKDLLLGVIYISPINSSYTTNKLKDVYETWEILEEEIIKFKDIYNVCLSGDFNARTGLLCDYIVNDDTIYTDLPINYNLDMENISRNNCDKKINAFGKRLIELCKMCGIRIMNGRKLGDSVGKMTCHEYNGSSAVDYFLADSEIASHIRTVEVLDRFDHISDHCPISVTIDVNINIFPRESKSNNLKTMKAPINIKWNKLTENQFVTMLSSQYSLEKINSLAETNISNSIEIEESVNSLTGILTDAANIKPLNRNLSKKYKHKQTKTNKQWYSEDLSLLKKELKRLGSEFVKSNKNDILRQRFFKLKKKYKHLVIKYKRSFKQRIYNQLENMSENSPKEYWELFEQLKTLQNGSNSDDSNMIDDSDWIQHYTKLLGPKTYDKNRIDEIQDEIEKFKNVNIVNKMDYEISIEEIQKAVKQLKNNKAVGIDQVKNEMIKASVPVIIKALKNIFNAILTKQYYPSEWKKGIIINLFKTGDKTNTDNYRGLTVNSCLGKLFNCILNNRLTDFLDKNKIIHDSQIGFKKKARTSDHIFILNTIFRKYVKSNQKLFVCFVDFKKAYDCVWREALKLKLLRQGIRGNFWGVISNMMSENESHIKSDGLLSKGFPCETGVRQGDVLSPNLFNLFLNDLPGIFENSSDSPGLGSLMIHCLLYADDLILFSLSEPGMQDKLNKLKEYCEKWSLNINTKKTQVMEMSNLKMDHTKGVITFGETKLIWTDCYKYLGIEVHNNGNMIATSENLCSRAWKAIFKMKSAFKDIDVNPKLQIKMFEILVRPILCYNSEIWGPFNYSSSQRSDIPDLTLFWNKIEKIPVEKFQLRFLKGLLGVHSKAYNAAVMGEVGRYPIFCYIIQNILRYISHLDEVINDRPLLAAAVSEDKLLPKTKSWHKKVESLLQLFGFELKDTSMLGADLIKKIKTHLQRSYEDFWHFKLGDPMLDSGKLNVYRKIKSHFRFEPYLSNIHMFKYRRSITALRISSHNLEVEVGRYVQKKGGKKKYKLKGTKDIACFVWKITNVYLGMKFMQCLYVLHLS